MLMAKSVEKAIELVNGKELYLEDDTFYWVVTKENQLIRVLKPRSKEKIEKILLDGEFPEKHTKEILSGNTKKTEALRFVLSNHDNKGLLLSGKTGIGKTFAATYKIAKLLQEYKITSPLYISLQDFDLKKEQQLKRIYDHDCFLIDDLNTNLNSWEKKFAIEVIYHAFKKPKPLFITTNASIKDLFGFLEEEPVISRLLEMCELKELKDTKDYRLAKRR